MARRRTSPLPAGRRAPPRAARSSARSPRARTGPGGARPAGPGWRACVRTPPARTRTCRAAPADLVTDLERHLPLQHVEALTVAGMHVQRGAVVAGGERHLDHRQLPVAPVAPEENVDRGTIAGVSTFHRAAS